MGAERKHEGVRAASASSIEIDFYCQGQRCKERIKLQPTPANLKRAAQHRAAILLAIENGSFDYAVTFPDSKNVPRLAKRGGDVLTVATFLDSWLDRKSSQLKASTWDDYRKTINAHLVPSFGTLRLAELTRPVIRAEAAKMTAGNKRIGNVLSVLRSALNEALEDELIDSNPLTGWTYRKTDEIKEDDEPDPFTREEQASILANLDGQARNVVQFMLWTGLRPSEMIALNWTDVDWQAGEIRIRRATTQAAVKRAALARFMAAHADNDAPPEQVAESTKTRSGRRQVKILGPAMEALQAQKAFTWLAGNEIFQNPRTGQRWTGDQPLRKTMWAHAIKRSGVRYRNPYQTRHTYASMLLSAGENPMWVANQMGHKDWAMIRRVYGRWIPDTQPDAGNKAEATFGQPLVDIPRKPITSAA